MSTIPEIKTEENPAQTLSSKGQEKKTEKQTTSQKQVDSLFQVGVNDIYKTKFEFQRLVASSGNAERLSSLFNKMEEQLLKLKKLATNEEDVDFVQKKSKDCEDLKQAFMRYLKREIDNLTSQINRIQESKVGEPSQQPLEDMISQKKKYDEILASVQKN